jgi:glutathione S-transferase
MSADLILHHVDYSPFAEKARVMLGLKKLAWRSVQIPLVMPKPDLTALTGGYRKTPVLQIGADVYCDTRLIAVELERRFPMPSLFPSGSRGLALALSAWSDRAFFEPGAGLSMALNRRGLPQAVIDDRKAFFNFMDFDRLDDDVPHLHAQLRAQVDLVEQQLADGRPYLLGDQPGLADIHAWFPVWMTRGNVPTAAEILAGCDRLEAWERRIAALGHGTRTEIEAAEAHAVAGATTPEPGQGVDPRDPLGLKVGDDVVVEPDDYGRVPVSGTLVTLQRHEVAVRRHDERCGTVVVHFPRIGYRVAAV